jgi:hypothetical protein
MFFKSSNIRMKNARERSIGPVRALSGDICDTAADGLVSHPTVLHGAQAKNEERKIFD